MCGIIAGFYKEEKGKVNKDILNIFEDQYERGTEGFGIVGINKTMKPEIMRSTEGTKFMFDLHKKEWNMMLVHHRFPTSTPNKLAQTHPILVSNPLLPSDFIIVHNGVICNGFTLKPEHEKLGFKYTTEFQQSETYKRWNDSEVIAIELALLLSKKSEIIQAEGSAALIALEINKENGKVIKVHFTRNNGNPLHLAASRGKIMLSSEGPGDNIKPFTLYSFDPKGDMKLHSKSILFKEEVKTPYVPYKEQAKSPTEIKAIEKTERSMTGPNGEKWAWDEESECFLPTPTIFSKSNSSSDSIQISKPITGFTDATEIDEIFDEEMDQMTNDILTEIEQFANEIADPTTCEFTDPIPYLTTIREIMEQAKKEKMRKFENEILENIMENNDLPLPINE